MVPASPSPDSPSPGKGIPLPLIRWRGFTLQLFLFTVLPLTMLLLGIVVVSQSLHHNEMRALVGDRDLRAVRASANDLANEIQHRQTALEALSLRVNNSPSGGEFLDPSVLDAAARSNGFDGGLAVFDAQGRLVAKSTGAAPEITDYQRVSAAGLMEMDPSSSPASPSVTRVSPPVHSSQNDWLLLGLAQPGGPYSLAGAFSTTSLAHEALAGVTDEHSGVMLVSGQGDILYASGPMEHTGSVIQQPGVSDVLRGESGVNYTSSGGGMLGGHSGEHLIAFSPVSPFGWGLVLEEPWEQSAGPLLNATQSAPLILAPVLILALLALWFGARRVIQPLQALESRTERLAEGDFSAIRAPVGGIGEIQNLQDELVKMAEALQSAQEALHAYIGALTAGLETERRSLARELHDDTLQALIALNQHVQMALLHANDPQQRQSLLDLQGRVSETIANLRRAIGGLRPIYLEDLGLVAALGMLAKNNGDGKRSEQDALPLVEFRLTGQEHRLAPETELALYRIAQEALNNAIHHAQATQVLLELAFDGKATQLTIFDNGHGFTPPEDPGAFAHSGHYGLLGMHERADLVGAEMKIESEQGSGTKVSVSIR
jgi:signal transduction histidine kinase